MNVPSYIRYIRSYVIYVSRWIILFDTAQIKAIVKRFNEMEGVRGVIITDQEGLPLSSDLPTDTTENVAAHITSLVGRSKNVVDALGEGAVKFLRMETDKGEVMVAPDEGGLILIVLK
ncbi:MAG: roadblock/LC7 domain-containing protein [Promethearchaeota archaeon]